MTAKRKLASWHIAIPFCFLVVALAINVIVFNGSPHIPLILATSVAAIVGRSLGFPWRELEEGMVKGISQALQASMILLIIGTLIGTWVLAGIVPAMVVYGLKMVSANLFPLTACLICAIISLATGSSWSTAGTVGVALIGVAQGLNIPLPLAAGAVVSGAYFGDKMSPLSDTTNLAPAVAGTDIFSHVRHMVYTTAPSLAIALIAYLCLGLKYGGGEMDLERVQGIVTAIEARYVIHPLLLLPPVGVIAMVAMRVPALPALTIGAAAGGLFAWAFQGSDAGEIMTAALKGVKVETESAFVNDLLSRGGMEGMYSTLGLIMCALAFGGVLERTGMLEGLARLILKYARTNGGLILATVASCIGMNIVACDQYLAIVVPGRMYREAFIARGLHLKNLSRALEDSGTLTSPLVPWNTCGAFMSAALGVTTFSYLPFAFLNLINPIVSITYGFTGITIARANGEAKQGCPDR